MKSPRSIDSQVGTRTVAAASHVATAPNPITTATLQPPSPQLHVLLQLKSVDPVPTNRLYGTGATALRNRSKRAAKEAHIVAAESHIRPNIQARHAPGPSLHLVDGGFPGPSSCNSTVAGTARIVTAVISWRTMRWTINHFLVDLLDVNSTSGSCRPTSERRYSRPRTTRTPVSKPHTDNTVPYQNSTAFQVAAVVDVTWSRSDSTIWRSWVFSSPTTFHQTPGPAWTVSLTCSEGAFSAIDSSSSSKSISPTGSGGGVQLRD